MVLLAAGCSRSGPVEQEDVRRRLFEFRVCTLMALPPNVRVLFPKPASTTASKSDSSRVNLDKAGQMNRGCVEYLKPVI